MLGRRLPHMFTQVRLMTTRRPKYEHAEARQNNTNVRMWAMGLRHWPAITASRDDTVFSIQQRVFGYDRGGEGFARPGFTVRPGKQPVPARTGRKELRKAVNPPPFTDWYPEDFLGKLRFQEMRAMRNNPVHEIESYLGPHKIQAYGLEDFGPFMPDTTEYERARRRGKAQFVLDAVKENPMASALKTTVMERRRLDTIQALRKRGKGAPKKGQGKRASGGKAGKK